jgi:hypothetical protein
MFGKACSVKNIGGNDYWYYGKMKCDEERSGPFIYFEDTGKEADQVQIQFDKSGIAVGVNAI